MTSAQQTKKVGIGVGVMVFNNNGHVLIGKRLREGVYGFPGGHLEKFEAWEDCASRETAEEAGLIILKEQMETLCVLNCVGVDENYHYTNIIMVCKKDDNQEPKNLEPHVLQEWEWWSIDDLYKRKEELFIPIKVLLSLDSEVKLEQICQKV